MELIHAHRHGEGAALRDPRGRPHRGAGTVTEITVIERARQHHPSVPRLQRRNYVTPKNKKKTTERLEIAVLQQLRKHTDHKETKEASS